MSESKENLLGISWHDSAWIPILNPTNVMDYFSERSNPFYDRSCNNELLKMQRLPLDQLNTMTGLEYILLHVQEPILYVVRKQHRHSASMVTPLSDYYIVAGVIYQAPDLSAVLNSRILSSLNHLLSAFEEANGFSRYHPSQGYWWEFKANEKEKQKEKEKPVEKVKEEASSLFQRKRVDILLAELAARFPPQISSAPTAKPSSSKNVQPALLGPTPEEPKPEGKIEVKQEKVESQPDAALKPPPEKKPRLG